MIHVTILWASIHVNDKECWMVMQYALEINHAVKEISA